MNNTDTQIHQDIQDVLESMNLLLYCIHIIREGGVDIYSVNIYAKDRNISLDECAKAHKAIYPLLEEAKITNTYTVQIGSAGIEKPLIDVWHYELAIGENIKIKSDVGGVSGELISIKDNIIEVLNKMGETKKISLLNIKTAKTLFKI